MQVPIRVLYLDRSMDSAGADPAAVNHHDFVPEALAGALPGSHFSILHPLLEAKAIAGGQDDKIACSTGLH